MSPHDVRAGTEGGGGGGIAPTIHTRGPRSDTWSTPRPSRFTARKTRYKKHAGGFIRTGTQNLASRRSSISGPRTPKRMAIPTELFRARILMHYTF